MQLPARNLDIRFNALLFIFVNQKDRMIWSPRYRRKTLDKNASWICDNTHRAWLLISVNINFFLEEGRRLARARRTPQRARSRATLQLLTRGRATVKVVTTERLRLHKHPIVSSSWCGLNPQPGVGSKLRENDTIMVGCLTLRVDCTNRD